MFRKGTDPILLIAVLALVGIGLIMVLSASSVQSLNAFGNEYHYFKKQLAWAVLGILALFIFSAIDYHILAKYARVLLLFAFIGLILVLIPQLGRISGGSRRWLVIGNLWIQASEIAKIVLVLYMAKYLSEKSNRFQKSFAGVLPPLLLLGVTFLLILLQPDLGTAITIGGTAVIMFFAAGIKISHLFVLGIACLPVLYYFIMGEDYRRERMLAFLNPWQDPLDTGFHIIQSLYALGSGGLFGTGFGQSKQKFYYLPAPSTDFIFAVLGEEMGFLGALLILCLFFLFAWRGFVIALNAPDLLGSLMAAGLTTMVVLQALINIAVVSGSIPITGISLPFISYGGSSLVIMMSVVGIVLNISRQARGHTF